MEKAITRRFTFNAEEIRDALIAFLNEREQALPITRGNELDLRILPDGVTLTWTETIEL